MHEDLVGYQFTNDLGHTLEVKSDVTWSDQYVYCEEVNGNYYTCRLADQLRTHRTLNAKVEE